MIHIDGIAMELNNKKDILLLLLYSPGKTDEINESIRGRTRIVKMMYLFKKEVLKYFEKGTEITEENFYNFFPWNFGPFCTEIYDDLTFFILQDFVEEVDCFDESALPESEEEWEAWLENTGTGQEETRYEYIEREYKLTSKGIKFVEQKLWGQLSNRQKKLLKEFKNKIITAPLRALLRYVYTRYKNDIVNSLIKEEILGN